MDTIKRASAARLAFLIWRRVTGLLIRMSAAPALLLIASVLM
jgi:hypothetical protein